MNFDIEGARKAGYSDAEIASHLAKQSGFDADGARKAGYSDSEILSHLSTPAPAPERSTLREVGRAVGRTVRAGIKGIAAPATMVGDALGLNSSAALNTTLNQAGLPQPENETERFAENVAGAMTGAGGMVGAGRVLSQAASPVTAAVGRTMSSGPGIQTVSAGTGAASADIARESGAGIPGQIAAGIAGSLAPTALSSGAAAAVRGAVRGGEAGRQRMEGRIDTLADAGVTAPSVGQASGTRRTQALEAGLSRTPGGAGVMAAQAEKTAEEMGKRVATIAGSDVDAASAGRSIKTGVEKFLSRFKAEQSSLYSKLDDFLPGSAPVDVTNFRAALQQHMQQTQGAENLLATFRTPKVEQAFNALMKDANQGPMTWEAVKQVRSVIGEKISNAGMNPDISRKELQSLYAALSADMRDAAYAAGPKAEQAFNRANAFSAAGYRRIDDFLDRVTGKDTMEKIYRAAVNPSEIREGASTINSVMRSLDPAEREIVKSAFIKRLGIATSGAQDAAGEVFSVRTFLTNWNKVSEDAKRQLLAGGGTAKDMDAIANAAGMLDKASKVFSNPSGTAQASAQQFLYGGATLSALSGNVKTAAALLAAPVVANMNAKLMTNQKFVHWLARSTKLPEAVLPSQINSLGQMKFDAETKPAVDAYLSAVRENYSDQSRFNVPVPK